MKTTKTAVEDKMLFIAAKLRCEVCLLKRKEERKHSAVEMNYLRRSARVSRLHIISNTTIRNKIQAVQLINIGQNFKRLLKCYEHLRIDAILRRKKIY